MSTRSKPNASIKQHGVGRRTGEPAEMTAARHRANEDGIIGEVFGEPNAVAEQRAMRKRRAGIDRDHADALARGARVANQARGERRLSDARRPGEADRHRAPRLRVERANEFPAAPRLRRAR